MRLAPGRVVPLNTQVPRVHSIPELPLPFPHPSEKQAQQSRASALKEISGGYITTMKKKSKNPHSVVLLVLQIRVQCSTFTTPNSGFSTLPVKVSTKLFDPLRCSNCPIPTTCTDANPPRYCGKAATDQAVPSRSTAKDADSKARSRHSSDKRSPARKSTFLVLRVQ